MIEFTEKKDLNGAQGPGGFQPERPAGGSWSGPIGAFLLYALVMLLFLVGGAALTGWGASIPPRLLAFLSQMGFVLLPALLAVRATGGNARELLGLRRVSPLLLLVSGGLALAALPVLSLMTYFSSRFPMGVEELERSIRKLIVAESLPELVWVLILAAVVPAVSEELLFRGWILSSLRRGMSIPASLVIQGLLFGLLHAHPIRIVPMTLFGVLLGWIVVRTRSVLPAIFGHAIYNGLIVLAAQYVSNTDPSNVSFGVDELVLPAGCSVLIVLGIVTVSFLTAREGEPQKEPELPSGERQDRTDGLEEASSEEKERQR